LYAYDNNKPEEVMEQKSPEHDKVYRFFVDRKQYESTKQFITGAQLRAIAHIDPAIGIFLEEHGHDKADRPITDTSSIDLAEPGVEKFYTVPPATFGLS
jgi:hypothetical protein